MRCYSQTFVIAVNCPLSGPAPQIPASTHSHIINETTYSIPHITYVLFNINLDAFAL